MLPKRKPNRLPIYDYSQNGMYFITICTKDKRQILGRINCDTTVVGDGVLDVPRVALSPYGKIVEQTLHNMENIYEDVKLANYVIMPNHIHIIFHIETQSVDCGTSRTPSPTRANEKIPRLISTLKRFTNQTCDCSLWQRSYHDHIIRTEAEYLKIWQYIDTNPIKWELDIYHVQ